MGTGPIGTHGANAVSLAVEEYIPGHVSALILRQEPMGNHVRETLLKRHRAIRIAVQVSTKSKPLNLYLKLNQRLQFQQHLIFFV